MIFSEIYTAYWHLFIVVLAKYSAVKRNREVIDMAQIPESFPERKESGNEMGRGCGEVQNLECGEDKCCIR